MNRTRIAALGICAAVVLGLVASGKGDDTTKPAATMPAPAHESIRMKSVAIFKSVVDALKTVKDEASSKAAAASMADVPKQIAALQAEDAKLPKMTADEVAALNKKLNDATSGLNTEMSNELTRINKLPPNVSGPVMDATLSIGPLPPIF